MTAVEVVPGNCIQHRLERQACVISQFEGVDPARLTTAGDAYRLIILQACGYRSREPTPCPPRRSTRPHSPRCSCASSMQCADSSATSCRHRPQRPHRRGSRSDLCRRRSGPVYGAADRLPRHLTPAPPGAQDRKHRRQGAQTGPRRREGRPPHHHERPKPAQGAQSRPTLRRHLGEDLPQGRHSTLTERKQVRTTNAIERRFREVRRSPRPMGTFQDRTSMDHILFAVFTLQNKCQRTGTQFTLTHDS